jgi:diadenosine tetraphosphate (Ap4A) HIT family hydrolase
MSVYELTDVEQRAVWELVGDVREHLMARIVVDAFTIGVNDGAAAGQSVPHAHVHVIPRRIGDVPDPRGGIRWVIADKAAYWKKQRMPPTSDEQIQFLINVQRLLDEGPVCRDVQAGSTAIAGGFIR